MRLWKLEAIRGLAAAYVALSHLAPVDAFLLRFGQEAVMVFFLLSGFVIEHSHSNVRNQSFKAYFSRRFTRIYSVVIPMFLVVSLIERPDVTSVSFWKVASGNLLMLQDFHEAKPNVVVPTLFASALWSLHYEWWFYMLYAAIQQWVPAVRQRRLVIVCGVLAAVFYASWPHALPRLVMYFLIW